MSGCQQAAFRAKLCWAAMLSAAPVPQQADLDRVTAEQPAPVAVVLPEFEPAFEEWWESDGQYCRSGGGSYEKTFAYRAYEAALADVTRLNTM